MLYFYLFSVVLFAQKNVALMGSIAISLTQRNRMSSRSPPNFPGVFADIPALEDK